jgi:5-methylcytosine-specific restriction endonuclease McrA
MRRALILNASWEALHFTPDIEAFIMVYKGIAEIIDLDGKPSVWEGQELTSPGRLWPCPATIRLKTRVNKKWRAPRFRKKVLFNRDNWQCQYCRMTLNWTSVTIDHVQPRSRGGGTTWKNCVASCKACNKRKADRTPAEAGMPLIKQPGEPSPLHFWGAARGTTWHEHWDLFVPSSE